MGNAGFVLNIWIVGPGSWTANWVCGMLLIFLTVVIHVTGLGLMTHAANKVFSRIKSRLHSSTEFVVFIGVMTLLVCALHVVEISIWAVSYLFLDALPDTRPAVLYSLNAMTSYGHESLFLAPRWELLGATEALNGWLLFALTGAFLFGLYQKALKLEGGYE